MDLQNDDGNRPRIPIPIIALDTVNLHELYMWSLLAREMFEQHGAEAKATLQAKLPDGLGILIHDEDMVIGLKRLNGFIASIAELIQDIRVSQAEAEVATIEKDKLH